MSEEAITSKPGPDEAPTDWEAVFEAEGTGFIPLLQQAQSPLALRKSMLVIVEMLFSRVEDAEARENYTDELKRIIPEDGGSGKNSEAEALKSVIIDMLRQIKVHRIKMAEEEHAPGQADGADEDRRSPDGEEAHVTLAMEEAEAGAAEEGPEPPTLEQNFADAFVSLIDDRLKVLRTDVPQDSSNSHPLPFILSADFAAHFEAILRKHFLPDLMRRCKGIVARAESQPHDERMAFFKDYFEDRNTRAAVWEQWQDTWKSIVQKTEVPPKPKEVKKKSLLSALKKEKARPAYFQKTLTVEDWQKQVKEIKKTNKRADEIWVEISEDRESYVPPDPETDDPLLMELFGRSAAGLQEQISAIRQIVEQGINMGRVFDSYQDNKNLDLALLAACFQNQDLFLDENAALKVLLRGQTSSNYPLVGRFLSDFIRKAR